MIIITWGFQIYEECFVNMLEYYSDFDLISSIYIGFYDEIDEEMCKKYSKLKIKKLCDYNYDVNLFYDKMINELDETQFFITEPFNILLFDNIDLNLLSEYNKIIIGGFKFFIDTKYFHANKYILNEKTYLLNKNVSDDKILKFTEKKPIYISLQMCYPIINYVETNKESLLLRFNEHKKLFLENKEKFNVYYSLKYHIKNKLFELNDLDINKKALDKLQKRLPYTYSEKIMWIEKNEVFYPKVSIIMPVYNKEKHLESSINSILNQSYSNIELIIVDDSSIDNSRDILEKYKFNPKIKIFYNEKNQGCYYSRNLGIKNASGDYIGFQDSDDYSLSTRIEYQINFMYRNNLSMCGCNMIRTHILNFGSWSDDEVLLEYKKTICKEGKDCCEPYFGYPTMIYKKELFDKYGLFIERRKGMDMEFPERILYKELGFKFKENDNSWEFFDKLNNQIYKKLEKVLYLSSQMDSTNITNLLTEDEFLQNKLWRLEYK